MKTLKRAECIEKPKGAVRLLGQAEGIQVFKLGWQQSTSDVTVEVRKLVRLVYAPTPAVIYAPAVVEEATGDELSGKEIQEAVEAARVHPVKLRRSRKLTLIGDGSED